MPSISTVPSTGDRVVTSPVAPSALASATVPVPGSADDGQTSVARVSATSSGEWLVAPSSSRSHQRERCDGEERDDDGHELDRAEAASAGRERSAAALG